MSRAHFLPLAVLLALLAASNLCAQQKPPAAANGNTLATQVYPVEDLVVSHDEKGRPTDGSQALVELVNSVLGLGARHVEGTSVQIVAAKAGKGLSVTHNQSVQLEVAELLEQMRSAAAGRQPAPKNADQRPMKAALKQPVQLEFVDMPLCDIIDYLKDAYKIEIQLDQEVLRDVAVDSNTPVSVNFKGISLRSALDLMLRDLHLDFAVQDDHLLLITSPERAEKLLVTRAYNVADLVAVHEAGNVKYAYRPLIEATIGQRQSEADAQLKARVRPYSNGAIQLLVVRRTEPDQHAIADLLASLSKVGRRTDKAGPSASLLLGEEPLAQALAATADMNFQDTPLHEVVDYLRDAFHIQVQLDHHALSDLSVEPATPVTVKVAGGTLRAALEQALSPMKLTCTIRDEVLLITSRDEAEAYLVTKVYAVGGMSEADLPKIDTKKTVGCRTLISSDAVRALVVTAPYAVQEQIAAKLKK